MKFLEVSYKTGRWRQETSDEHPSWRKNSWLMSSSLPRGKAGYFYWPLLKTEFFCSEVAFPWSWWSGVPPVKALHIFQLTQTRSGVSCISLKKISLFSILGEYAPFPSMISCIWIDVYTLEIQVKIIQLFDFALLLGEFAQWHSKTVPIFLKRSGTTTGGKLFSPYFYSNRGLSLTWTQTSQHKWCFVTFLIHWGKTEVF